MPIQSIESTQERSRLGTAFMTALLLHVSALAAVTFWPHETDDPPGEQEITIDLAPAMEEVVSVAPAEVSAVAAPPVEPEPVPLEAETVESLPPDDVTAEQPEEVAELPEPQDTMAVPPVEAEMATEPEPVVALPPPETVVAKPLDQPPPPKPEPRPERKPPPKPVERKRPPRRMVAEPQPPQSAQQGRTSASREDMEGSAASADPAARSRYFASLRAALRNRLRIPDALRNQGFSGTATVRFTIDPSGRIVSASLVRSAGHPAADQAALAAATLGSSVPPAPDFVPERTFAIPLGFSIR